MVGVAGKAARREGLGGLAGADAECTARAQAGGLPGSYRAWLSATEIDAKSRVGSGCVPQVSRRVLRSRRPRPGWGNWWGSCGFLLRSAVQNVPPIEINRRNLCLSLLFSTRPLPAESPLSPEPPCLPSPAFAPWPRPNTSAPCWKTNTSPWSRSYLLLAACPAQLWRATNPSSPAAAVKAAIRCLHCLVCRA